MIFTSGDLLRIHDTYKWELVNGQLLLALMDWEKKKHANSYST